MDKLTLAEAFNRLEQVLPGYEARASQLDLARMIQRGFAEGLPMLFDAPTGIGKSFAGLVPALLSGKRAVVATATIALQDQYLDQDIPVLQKGLGAFKAALVKGRRHYVSLRRLEQSLLAPAPLKTWAYRSTTGDWAELPQRPDPLVWDEVRSDAEDCMGKNCSFFQECHFFAARRELEQADLLVVNHALLLADHLTGGSLLPPYDLLIIDEAHQFYEYATHAFTSELSNFGLRHLLRRIRKHFPDLRNLADACEQEGGQVFLDLRAGGNSRPLLPDAVNLSVLFQRLEQLRETLQRLGTKGDAEQQMHREKISQLLGSYSRHLDHLGHSERLPDLVNWVQTDGKRVALLSTPLDVAPQIRDWLFAPGGPTTVFMSATLSLGGSDPFAYFRKQVGLEAGAALEQEFPSPFDYPKHCLLYLPKHLPMPNELAYNAAVAEEVKDLLAVSQGRAFVLFTATRAMVEVHQLVAEQVPWPCRHQEQSSKRALLDWFLTTPNAVLFGVNSFWEGVSVVGSQLSLVIIDRCPFQSPGDPVYDARCEQVRQQQGSWFEQLALPHAALRLKQGCGRLIRTSSDRGIIALLDPRLTRKGYGKVLRQSLPPGRVVHELDPALFQQYLVVP